MSKLSFQPLSALISRKKKDKGVETVKAGEDIGREEGEKKERGDDRHGRGRGKKRIRVLLFF